MSEGEGEAGVRYLHGYDATERARLGRQARFLAPKVHADLPFERSRRLLEVGCGVGAQTELLLEAFPALHVTGVDIHEAQLAAARAWLGQRAAFEGRFDLHRMDASATTFADGAFDGAFLCWILEHVPDPVAVLRELRRVLAPGAEVACSEVLNASLAVHPSGSALARYWGAYNEHQRALHGDPFVGVRLANLFLEAGFRAIEVSPRTYTHDDRDPAARAAMVAYFVDLLRSGAAGLLEAGLVDEALVTDAVRDMRAVDAAGGAFLYTFVHLRARR